MPDSNTYHENYKLVRCEVLNRYNETSTRFVVLEAFKLWEYLMQQKHGLRVGKPELCLWLDNEAYERGAAVFDRAGKVEPVNRIAVDLFDTEYGFSQTITRFTRASETIQLLEILRSHIPAPLNDSDACTITVTDGQAVQKWHPNARRNILTGLEG